MAPKKLNIKERISDGEIDLSMSDLQEVPVKELAVYKKAYSLDLSNNFIKVLPQNFAPSLVHLTKLDLSKNELKELPENFGDLTKLKYLDLYHNQLQYLPLSFSKLKSLKWLDLKDNPLVPAVAKVAGQCLDAKQCQMCAKHVVEFFVQVQEQITNDMEVRQKQRQKQLEMNQQKQNDTKKSKKKEKTKQKTQPQQQQQQQQKNGPIKDNAPASGKKSKKSPKTYGQQSNILSVIRSFFISFIFVLSIIFVLTSIDCWLTRNIHVFIVNVFNQNINTLPSNVKDYVLIFTGYVKQIHDKTGNLTNTAINTINNKENIDYIYEKVNILKDLIQNKTRELYRNFAS